MGNAYLSPILERYTDGVQRDLPPAERLQFMQSKGGLADARAFHGKDAILSYPAAGGVVRMVAACEPLGHRKFIRLDMGGSSTDVSHYAGTLRLTS